MTMGSALTGISAISGDLGKGGKLIEDGRGAETRALSSGSERLLSLREPVCPTVESTGLSAMNVIIKVPSARFNCEDGATYSRCDGIETMSLMQNVGVVFVGGGLLRYAGVVKDRSHWLSALKSASVSPLRGSTR
jgi:hypothetical protein